MDRPVMLKRTTTVLLVAVTLITAVVVIPWAMVVGQPGAVLILGSVIIIAWVLQFRRDHKYRRPRS